MSEAQSAPGVAAAPAAHPDPAGPPAGARVQVHGRLLARNTIFNFVGMALPMLVALVTIPPLIRGMGKERFGILAIAWMLLSYLGELGLGRATTKYVAEALGGGDADAVATTAWTTVAIQAAFGVLCGAALAVVTPVAVGRLLAIPASLEAEARTAFLLLAGALPLVMLTGSLRGVLEAAQRFDLVNAVRIPATVANYALPLGAVALGARLPGVLGLILVSRVAAAVSFYLLGVRVLPELRGRPRFRRTGLRRLVGFGGWVTVSSIAAPLLSYLDRLMLGVLVTMTAVAYYAAPYEMVMRLVIIPSSVMSALFPAFSALDGQAQGERIGRLARRSAKGVLLVLAPMIIVLMGGARDILGVWLGADFARESTAALAILAAGVLVNALAYVPYVLVQGVGRADLTGKFHLLEVPVQLVSAWVLVGAWGIVGAALAWSLRATLDAALLYGAAARLSSLTPRALLAERVPQTTALVLGAGVLAAALSASLVGLAPRMLALAGVLAVVVAGLWRFALSAAERAELAGAARAVAARTAGG